LKNREFVRAIATASLAETYFDTPAGAPAQPVALEASIHEKTVAWEIHPVRALRVIQ